MKNDIRRLLYTTIWIGILIVVFLCLGLSNRATGTFIGLLIGLPLAALVLFLKSILKR
jgi:hypothetical protein